MLTKGGDYSLKGTFVKRAEGMRRKEGRNREKYWVGWKKNETKRERKRKYEI